MQRKEKIRFNVDFDWGMISSKKKKREKEKGTKDVERRGASRG